MKNPCTATKSGPRSPQLEKVHTQQQRPNTAKKKKKKEEKQQWQWHLQQFVKGRHRGKSVLVS